MTQNRLIDTSQTLGEARYRQPARARLRRNLRYLAVALCILVAVMYLLIGLRVLHVLESPSEQTVFGLIAGAGYVLAAVLLLLFKRRWLYITGALLQGFIILTYFNLAAERLPAYELWGLVLRLPQLAILVTLFYLALSPQRTATQNQPTVF